MESTKVHVKAILKGHLRQPRSAKGVVRQLKSVLPCKGEVDLGPLLDIVKEIEPNKILGGQSLDDYLNSCAEKIMSTRAGKKVEKKDEKVDKDEDVPSDKDGFLGSNKKTKK